MDESDDQGMPAEAPSVLFSSPLLSDLSDLVARWTSHRFQTLHASRLKNDLDFAANKTLYVLGSNGPSRPSALAEQLVTGRANVSKVVSRLEAQGLAMKVPDTDDSRAFLVALTPQGVEASQEVFRIGDEMLREMTAEWSPEEVESFSRQMARLTRAAAAYEHRLGEEIAARKTAGDDAQ